MCCSVRQSSTNYVFKQIFFSSGKNVLKTSWKRPVAFILFLLVYFADVDMYLKDWLANLSSFFLHAK